METTKPVTSDPLLPRQVRLVSYAWFVPPVSLDLASNPHCAGRKCKARHRIEYVENIISSLTWQNNFMTSQSNRRRIKTVYKNIKVSDFFYDIKWTLSKTLAFTTAQNRTVDEP